MTDTPKPDNTPPGIAATDPASPPTRETHTRWMLTSYRSLSPRGFLILMSALGLVSFIAGTAFVLMGAWPVFGFFGLDVLLVYIAFRLNYRDGRLFETVDLSPDMLTLTRHHPTGREERFDFNPYWVRVACSEGVDGRTSLSLVSHGQHMVFGRFLTDGERKEFAGVLAAALQSGRIARA